MKVHLKNLHDASIVNMDLNLKESFQHLVAFMHEELRLYLRTKEGLVQYKCNVLNKCYS